MVAARVEVAGLDPWRLGGELWSAGSHLSGLCFSGANLVPIRGDRAALRQFADRARRGGRSCSSIVGRAELVLPMWDTLAVHWAPCREVRADQPLMVLAGPPAVAPDPLVRPVRPVELERYLPAAIAMFTEEVGIDPRAGDGGAGYRSRVSELVSAGRAFARFEGDQVDLQGRDRRALVSASGRSRASGCTRPTAAAGWAPRAPPRWPSGSARMGRVSSLYVNGFNHPARRAYDKVGFTQIASFATVLF